MSVLDHINQTVRKVQLELKLGKYKIPYISDCSYQFYLEISVQKQD